MLKIRGNPVFLSEETEYREGNILTNVKTEVGNDYILPPSNFSCSYVYFTLKENEKTDMH